MTIWAFHPKVSNVPPTTDPNVVSSFDWNDGHPIRSDEPVFSGYVIVHNGTNFIARQLRASDLAASFEINAFASNQPTLIELGSTITNPTFTASYSYAPTSASVADNKGTGSQDVISTPTAFTYTSSYTYTVYGTQVIWTLTANDGTGAVTATDSTTWTQKIFWGTGVPGGNTEAFIEALGNNELALSFDKTFVVNPAGTLKIYFACRAAYGTPTFVINEFFAGGFNGGTTIAVTNAQGVTENYVLYESNQILASSTTVEVS